jgi:hypothetical protein
MSPEMAQEIYHASRVAEWSKHLENKTPINERNTELAGFSALIDAVKKEVHTQLAEQYLKASLE